VRRVTGSGGSAKSVTIRAKGTASGGVWPLMSLYVNGQYRTQWMVSSSSYADYSATTTLTGNDQIEVVYSNDAGSRDLYVDYVVVDGRTVQAEGGAAVIDKGSGDAAFDGLEVIAGQQALYVNGALRFVVGTQAYAACYDANGNMTWRLLVDAAYEQLWDAENRLVQVKKGATVQATFVYDGDGARVKATVGSVTTAYVGSHFEWTGSTSTMKRYYYAGGERVAMRVGSSTVYWLLGDHLGSTAMTVASSGTWVAEVRYKAWGETRCSYGTTPTSYRFTGQRLESSLGLYLMGARWYDPGLSRWLSADTIVPNPANPQSLNRYSYVLGNPLRYRDPAGHWEEEWEQQFEQQHGCPPTEQDWWDYQFSLQFAEWIAGFWEHTASLRALLWNAGVTLQRGDIGWRIAQAELVGEAVRRVQDRFGGGIRQFVGGLTVILQSVVKPWWTRITDPKALGYGGYEALGKIFLGPNMNLSAIVHEMGHYWDEKQGLSREYWNQVGGSKFIDNRFEDFAESFRHYVLDVTAWPPPGNWTCSSQGCAYPIDFNRYDFFSQY